MSNKVSFDAAEHVVHSVTVFKSGGAEVTRKIDVDLKKGLNEIEIRKLPNDLVGDSIRIGGTGKAKVLDVIFKPRSPPHTSIFGSSRTHAIRPIKDSEVEVLLKSRAATVREGTTVTSQLSLLDTYARVISSNSSEGINSKELLEFLDHYGERHLKLTTKIHELEEQLRKVDEDIREARDDSSQDPLQTVKCESRIVVNVFAEEDGPAETELTYQVRQAHWFPAYDLRADIISSEPNASENEKSDGSTPNITLDYYAFISQQTGEDWTDVQLVLSTASLLFTSEVPKLLPVKLSALPTSFTNSFTPNVAKSSGPNNTFGAFGVMQKQSGDGQKQPSIFGGSGTFGGVNMQNPASDNPKPAFERAEASASSHGGGFCSTFSIDGRANVPTSLEFSNVTHKVTLSRLQFKDPLLEWTSAPKRVPSVFLKGRIKNTSDVTLLPGLANIFIDNNFVTKSSLPLVSPSESFSVSLGMDPSVRVTIHPQSKKVSKPTSGILAESRVSTHYYQTITIKNTRGLTIPMLIIKHQIPTSTETQIQVKLHEPALPDWKDVSTAAAASKEVNASERKNIRARWTRVNEDEDVEGEAGGEANTEGMFEWRGRVEANSSLDLKLHWEVNVPKDFKWVQH